MATFKERFLDLKKEKDLSLDELAKIFHTNKSSLSRIINGQLSLKKELLEEMAKYFNCTTDYLLGRTDDPDTKIIPREELPKELILAGIKGLEVFKSLNAKDLTDEDYKDILEAFAKINERHS